MQDQRTCSVCGQTKAMDEFYARRRRGRVERRYECKDCTKARLAKIPPENCKQRKHPVRRHRRWDRIKRIYGISKDDYYRLLEAQGGGCALCGAVDSGDGGEFLHVDHCHHGNGARGLLCNSCNTALGRFQDDPARLRAAVRYLERPPALVLRDPEPNPDALF